MDINISQTSPLNYQIDGIPDAVKLIGVDGPIARRLADVGLHRSDLRFAKDSLESVNRAADARMQEALFRCAILHYFKCFLDTGLRFQLDAALIYRDRPPAAMMNFQFFKDLRNKSFSHDENAYMSSCVAAAINAGTKPYKVEHVTPLVATFNVLGPDSYNNLMILIDHAERWLAGQADKCIALIRKDLENTPYEELAARPGPQHYIPTVEDAAKARR
jgi:hypothetical protein